MGERKLSELERSRLGDSIYKHPLIPELVGIDPLDGLPKPTTSSTMEAALDVPLTLESFVCMGDESEYVIRDEWGDITLRLAPSRVRRDAAGRNWVFWNDLKESERIKLQDARLFQEGEQRYEVTALRPPCTHYRRALLSFEGSQEHKHCERVCTAQRGENGEYVSLNSTPVYACEHRHPRDFVSEERLRAFDEKIVASAQVVEAEWDPDAPGGILR